MTRTRGRKATDFRNTMKSQWEPVNAACGLCGQADIDWDAPANTPDAFELDHIITVEAAPHLQFEPSNTRPTHHRCNRSRGSGDGPAAPGITSEPW